MNEHIAFATTDAPSEVHGVHGAAGETLWKCLAPGHGLTGAWEAVEWALLPPDGASGEHRHTRTEELYFILAGQGELSLNGQACAVAINDLILTGLGARHGLRNVGATDLAWLVIEMPAPLTTSVVRPTTVEEKVPMPNEAISKTAVIHLTETDEIDPRTVLSGPLRRVHLLCLPSDSTQELQANGQEHVLFVLAGDGMGSAPSAEVPLRPGTSLTLGPHDHLRLDAKRDGIKLFHAVLDSPFSKDNT